MPNWCENELTVSGPKADIERLLQKVHGEKEDEVLDFNKVIPYPEKFRAMDRKAREHARMITQMSAEELQKYVKKHGSSIPKDGYNSGGYEWCVHTWGTKWNADECIIRRGAKSVKFLFNTAWSPSIPITDVLAQQFPTLRFKHEYWECGMGYKGKSVFKDGILIDEDYSENYRGGRGG